MAICFTSITLSALAPGRSFTTVIVVQFAVQCGIGCIGLGLYAVAYYN